MSGGAWKQVLDRGAGYHLPPGPSDVTYLTLSISHTLPFFSDHRESAWNEESDHCSEWTALPRSMNLVFLGSVACSQTTSPAPWGSTSCLGVFHDSRFRKNRGRFTPQTPSLRPFCTFPRVCVRRKCSLLVQFCSLVHRSYGPLLIHWFWDLKLIITFFRWITRYSSSSAIRR